MTVHTVESLNKATLTKTGIRIIHYMYCELKKHATRLCFLTLADFTNSLLLDSALCWLVLNISYIAHKILDMLLELATLPWETQMFKLRWFPLSLMMTWACSSWGERT